VERVKHFKGLGTVTIFTAMLTNRALSVVWRRASLPRASAAKALNSVNARRTFAYNIYDETPQMESQYKGTPQETAEAIFLQHCGGDGGAWVYISPSIFPVACGSLAKEFPSLKPLADPALAGRAFELFDRDENGVIVLNEWLEGVDGLLNSADKFKNLVARLQQGMINHQPTDFSHVNRVAIIGGGVAGLQTARALQKIGKEVVVFEKTDKVGGVWRENYDNFGLQVPKQLYEFPEFPYPADKEWSLFPSGAEVQEYIERYTKHFGLQKVIRFNAGVSRVEVANEGDGRWKVFAGGKNEEAKEERFDFVVVATGMYGWPPHIPKFRGADAFDGEIYHSQTFQDASVCEGKDVVVVGGGKSAVDNAVSGAKLGKSSTLLYRSAHWPVPRLLCNLVPFQWGTYSRFGHFMLPVHHDVTKFAWYLHSVLTPVKWVWWRIVELMFRMQFRLTGDMVPEGPIEIDVFTGGQILNYDMRDLLKQGRVKAIKGAIEKIHPKQVELVNGTMLPCDVLVFGTGFTKSYDLFDRLIQEKLQIRTDGLFLYRNVLPPNIANLAFVGSEVSTFNNILTHSLQAEWLARVLAGKVEIPDRRRMLPRVEAEKTWKRSWMPSTSARSSILQLHMMKYHDVLMKDMGENHLRKGVNKLAEIFSPYCAADYRSIFQK
jgi:dimethylaniline monooxygenase (N-oxide forming)